MHLRIKWIYEEAAATFRLTFAKSMILLQIVAGMLKMRLLRFQESKMLVDLGHTLFNAGLGDSHIRQRISELAAADSTTPWQKRFLFRMRARLDASMRQLAKQTLANASSEISESVTMHNLQGIREEIDRQKESVGNLWSAVLPETSLEWRRTLVGFLSTAAIGATSLVFLIAGFNGPGNPPGEMREDFAEHTLVGSDHVPQYATESWESVPNRASYDDTTPDRSHAIEPQKTRRVLPSENWTNGLIEPIASSPPRRTRVLNSSSSPYLDLLTTDPNYGRLNRYIVAEVDQRISDEKLALEIGALNELAKQANLAENDVIIMFDDAKLVARRHGLGPLEALNAVKGSIAWQSAYRDSNR